MGEPLYCLKHVRLKRSGRIILENVTLKARAGEITVLAGPNGAGKTTALRVLAGSLPPDTGGAFLHGHAVQDFSPRALAQRRAVLSQNVSVSFDFDVDDVVRLGLPSHRRHSDGHSADLLMKSLKRARVEEFVGRRYHALSGGEQRRVQFARALAQMAEPLNNNESRWLLLDEPGASLDMTHELALMETLCELARKKGFGVIAAIHDLALARIFADHIVLMKAGMVVAEGTPDAILTPQRLEDVYDLPTAWRDWPLSRQAPPRTLNP